MIALGFDAPGGKIGGWAIYDSKRGRILRHAILELPAAWSERDHYEFVAHLFDELLRKYKITVIALEHPFLYRIAQWIGAMKMWASTKDGVTWYMLTNSSARKIVFGDAKRPPRDMIFVVGTKHRRLTAKEEILQVMQRWSKKQLTQHEADAMLYAMAAAIKLTTPMEVDDGS